MRFPTTEIEVNNYPIFFEVFKTEFIAKEYPNGLPYGWERDSPEIWKKPAKENGKWKFRALEIFGGQITDYRHFSRLPSEFKPDEKGLVKINIEAFTKVLEYIGIKIPDNLVGKILPSKQKADILWIQFKLDYIGEKKAAHNTDVPLINTSTNARFLELTAEFTGISKQGTRIDECYLALLAGSLDDTIHLTGEMKIIYETTGKTEIFKVYGSFFKEEYVYLTYSNINQAKHQFGHITLILSSDCSQLDGGFDGYFYPIPPDRKDDKSKEDEKVSGYIHLTKKEK